MFVCRQALPCCIFSGFFLHSLWMNCADSDFINLFILYTRCHWNRVTWGHSSLCFIILLLLYWNQNVTMLTHHALCYAIIVVRFNFTTTLLVSFHLLQFIALFSSLASKLLHSSRGWSESTGERWRWFQYCCRNNRSNGRYNSITGNEKCRHNGFARGSFQPCSNSHFITKVIGILWWSESAFFATKYLMCSTWCQ